MPDRPYDTEEPTMTRPIIVLTRVAYDVVRANARPDARFVDTARARPEPPSHRASQFVRRV